MCTLDESNVGSLSLDVDGASAAKFFKLIVGKLQLH